MMKKTHPVVSFPVYFIKTSRVLKFGTMLILSGAISSLVASSAQGDGIASSDKTMDEELMAYVTLPVISSYSPAEDVTLAEMQQRTVTGRVIDMAGAPLPGVNVTEKNTPNGTISGPGGGYTINVSSGTSVLVFSFVGYVTQEITVGSRATIDVTFSETSIGLDEVVVVGYGSQKKATITGSVAAIESSTLLMSPVSNISNALVGRISGLLTTQVSGAPGFDNTTMRIRGVGTFTSQNSPLVMIDGIESDNYNNLDPNEIENISVLKDASATAVYGVRGANGVLLITTKRGSVGKPQISFSSQVAISRITEEREFLPSYDWALNFNEGLKYDSYIGGTYIPQFTDDQIAHYWYQDDPVFYPNVDWADIMFKPYALQSQYNLNIGGGTERLRYFISAGYFNQGSVLDDDIVDRGFDDSAGFSRYNFRSNFDFNVTKHLTVKVNLSAQIANQNGNPGGASGEYGYYLAKTWVCPPNYSPGTIDGKVVFIPVSVGSNIFNPITMLHSAAWQRNTNTYVNGFIRMDHSLDFILQGLSVHGSVSLQNRTGASSSISKALVEYDAFPVAGGGYSIAPRTDEEPMGFSEGSSYSRREDAEVGFDYNRKFGNHSFTGLLLYNQSKEFPGPSLGIPRGYQSLVGRATYDFRKRYMAEFNFGYNGTENFAPGKRFGFFPAYSLGWVVTEEPFFPKNRVLTYLKIRGSYGQVGNDRVGGSRFLYNPTTYTYGGLNNYHFGKYGLNWAVYTGSGEGTLGNPDVTWERSKKTNVGFDASFWKTKIRVTLDFFSETRDNILAEPGTVPATVGTAFPYANFGKMNNQGFDGEINYNGKVGRLNYWIKGIFTISDNEVIYRDEVERAYPYLQRTGLRHEQSFGLIEQGLYNTWDEVIDAYRPVSQWSSNRIQPGDFRYKDVNGDGITDVNDQVPVGYSPFPGRSIGLSFGGDFRGFDISVLFQNASNYTHYTSPTIHRGWRAGPTSTMRHIYDWAWTYEKYLAGTPGDWPHLSASETLQTHNYQNNTFWQENSAYTRLKNVEIGYKFTPAPLKRLGVSSVRLYANANNLLTWSKLFPGEDPEVPNYTLSNNEPYPLLMTVNGGINITF